MKTSSQGIGMTSQRTRDRLVARLREEGIHNNRVLETMASTPRHLFLDEALATRAYEDTSLPIGHGQTISQPYIVARMTELLLEVEPKVVLEVGTGSGYQAAILAGLVDKVYSTERIEPLATQARQRFRQLGLRNIRVQHSDGSWGWPQFGPFDAIMVTAGAADIPEALLEQLKTGGRLVMPLGGRDQQTLITVTRTPTVYEREDFEPVVFVPLLGGEG
ncbi:protein-L-isoaspartate(D-aspartate) O-methyltransferase [Thiogranum longum]|uniref:Protein-L-isoaspartate O-methyltransferase n=1 Tax=Thiogranum longum TaxID=1537524 RepID=A0A4R1H979_9GAMM|nr:protein-L-isoaspartate(D-aspartate) O-methyltransferase [Thiogranum longum]TCK18424.1 protein-L-isoaspartate(D-aspartate) O-methyltransferase [Thiogranum longum]